MKRLEMLFKVTAGFGKATLTQAVSVAVSGRQIFVYARTKWSVTGPLGFRPRHLVCYPVSVQGLDEPHQCGGTYQLCKRHPWRRCGQDRLTWSLGLTRSGAGDRGPDIAEPKLSGRSESANQTPAFRYPTRNWSDLRAVPDGGKADIGLRRFNVRG